MFDSNAEGVWGDWFNKHQKPEYVIPTEAQSQRFALPSRT
jgi:hypothetical protein